jgi:hypothetical protein
MLAHLEHHAAVGCIENADHLAGSTQCHLTVIGANVSGQDRVVFLANLENALAALDVKGHSQARLAAAAASYKEQVAIAAESQNVDRSLGEGKDAHEMMIRGPIE